MGVDLLELLFAVRDLVNYVLDHLVVVIFVAHVNKDGDAKIWMSENVLTISVLGLFWFDDTNVSPFPFIEHSGGVEKDFLKWKIDLCPIARNSVKIDHEVGSPNHSVDISFPEFLGHIIPSLGARNEHVLHFLVELEEGV